MRYALVVDRVVLQNFIDEAKYQRETLDAAIRALEILSADQRQARRRGRPKGSKNKQKTASALAGS